MVVQAAPRAYSMTSPCAPPRAAPCGPVCDPPSVCCQRRDECGYPVDWCGDRYGRLDITIEGLYSFLNDPGDRPFGEETFDPDQIRWDGVEFDGEFGGRVTIGYRATASDRIEVRGAYYGKWDESADVDGVFGFDPGVGAGVDTSDPVFGSLRVESELYSGELNYWTEVSCEGSFRWDIGAGLRYLQFNEEASGDFTNAITLATGSVFADVDNTFFGAQLMGAVHWDVSERLEASFSAKALLGNLRREIEVTTDSVFVGGVSSGSSEEDEIVWGLDLEAGLKFRVTSWLAVTAGYEFLFLDNVQRAYDAMDFSHSDTGAVQPMRDEDQLVVHAFFFGLNLNF